MNSRFQQHLLEVQANEMVKYIDTLENNNEIMMKFIQGQGLGESFAQVMNPKGDVVRPSQPLEVRPTQVTSPLSQGGDTIANYN